MFRTLVHSGEIDVDGQHYVAHYFEYRTARGTRRYSCEVVLDSADRIIVDDDSMTSLEAKVTRLAPETVYSRLLATRRGAAA
jgi:hypothetical protein